MTGTNVNFGDKIFYKSNKVIKIDDIDVNKMLVSKEEPYRSKNYFNYFIGYNDDDAIRPLFIKLQQMIGYFRKFDGNRTISFKISYRKLWKKYNQIWKRVEKLLKTKFDSELVFCGNDNLKTKTKIYGRNVNTNFQGKKAPYNCLSIIILDSVVKANKKNIILKRF